MVLNRRLIVFLLIVVACPIFAQQQLPATGESIDVSLVNVDVFVTDRRGQRVTGLTTDDFEIRENGRLQPITNFAEYRPEHGDERAGDAPTTAPAAKRTILFFVERFGMPSFHTRPMFAQLRKTMHEVVRPGDAAAVVFWDSNIAFTLQTFTDNTKLLEAALREVETQSTGVSRPDDVIRRQAFARAYYETLTPEKMGRRVNLDSIDLWDLRADAHFARFRLQRKTEELTALIRSMSDADGRKIVIFATRDFGVTMGMSPTGFAPSTGTEFTTERFREAVARTANEHGVTLYPIYPPGLGWTPTISAAETREPPDLSRNARDYETLMNQTTALEELARETGGLTASGSSDIVSLLPRVAEDLTSYYSLAYRTPDTGKNQSRDISVRTKNREYAVRSRREYVEKTDATRMRDRVIANLYRPDANGSIKLHVEIGTIDKTSRTRWSAPVRVTIPIEALSTISLSTISNEPGKFSVFVATGGVLGVMSDVQQQTKTYSAADFTPGQQHFTYEFTLEFNGATSTVSIGVMDDHSKEFGLKTVDVPPYRPRDLVGSE
ncbi:MAG TPA: VWA domain-containing protein [Thermoanaerobaculia bacterium]|jgi:VWFA-related protein|nr:VWA domain-containing protein [Thermoanaerobaculia bacterium]